ncbi:MAG: NAD(P)-binding domain-containing protein [Candidatus Binatia bacterium]
MNLQDQFDYLILGAGPAGLQLGYYLNQARHPYAILEEGDSPGSFFKKMPRHRRLLSINKVNTGYEDAEINLRWDWNSLLTDDYQPGFPAYAKEYLPNADKLVRYLHDFAHRQQLNVRCGIKIVRVARDDTGFRAEDQNGQVYKCRWLIVATGLAKPYLPDVPGIQAAEHYDTVSIDPDGFRNQRVLIIGKGNSGFETANNLIDTAAVIHIASPDYVTFAWQSHYVGDLRAVNNSFLDTYLLKSQNAALEVIVEKIERSGGGFEVTVSYLRAKKSRATYYYDRIIACTGFRFDDDMFDENCRPETIIDGRFPDQTCCWEAINIPNMYFAGNLMQARDHRKTSSGFIHGFRYNIRALYRILEQRNHQRAWPSIEIGLWPGDAVSMIIQRLNRSSALWLQFGFLCDLIVEPDRQSPGRYYEEVPVDYAHTLELCGDQPYYIATLEYGRSDFDALRDDRVAHTDVDHAIDSTALHPVVRRYHRRNLLSEQHLIENLEAIWDDKELHVEPLRRFFEAVQVTQVRQYP